MNLMGLPVTALTERAAPPRASPSSLESMTPSMSSISLKAEAALTASWPVMASTTSRISVRLDGGLDGLELLHQRLVDMEAAGGVQEDHVVAVLVGVGDGGLGDFHGIGLAHLENREYPAFRRPPAAA